MSASFEKQHHLALRDAFLRVGAEGQEGLQESCTFKVALAKLGPGENVSSFL